MNLKRETVKLSVITGISVFGGLVFHILLGRKFGLSWQLDCFFIALTLYTLLCMFTAFFTSLYIPVFNEVKKESISEGIVFADVILKWLLLISILIIFLIVVFKYFIIGVIAPGFTEKGVQLSGELTGVIIFALAFYSISYLVTLTLNALHLYSVPAMTGLFEPVFNISAVFILIPVMGVKGIAISCLLSNMFKAAALLVYFYIKVGWRPTLVFYHPRLKELIQKSSHMAFSSFVWSLKDIIIRNAASRLGEGSVALFSYAEKIINTIILIVINPLARVFYSRVSEWMPFAQWDDIKLLFMRVVRTNVFFSFIISAGFIIFLPSFLNLIFYGSNITAEDIRVLSVVTNIMLAYFVIFSFEVYLTRVLMAAKRARVVAVNALIGVSVLFIASFTLSDLYGVYGLPVAVAVTEFVLCSLYYFFARQQLELKLLGLMNKFANAFFVMGMFIVLGVILRNYITDVQVLIFIVLPAWMVLYYLASKVFLKEELNILFSH